MTVTIDLCEAQSEGYEFLFFNLGVGMDNHDIAGFRFVRCRAIDSENAQPAGLPGDLNPRIEVKIRSGSRPKSTPCTKSCAGWVVRVGERRE